MKERIAQVALLVLVTAFVASVAYAVSLSTYDGVTFTTLLEPDAAITDESITGTAVSVAARQGIGTFLFTLSKPVGNAATYTNTVTIQHCATSGGTYAPLTNSAGTAVRATVVGNDASVTQIKCDMGFIEVYVRAIQDVDDDEGSASVVLSAY